MKRVLVGTAAIALAFVAAAAPASAETYPEGPSSPNGNPVFIKDGLYRPYFELKDPIKAGKNGKVVEMSVKFKCPEGLRYYLELNAWSGPNIDYGGGAGGPANNVGWGFTGDCTGKLLNITKTMNVQIGSFKPGPVGAQGFVSWYDEGAVKNYEGWNTDTNRRVR